MTNGRIAELATELTQCIDSCGLTGKELEDYLKRVLHEIADEAVTGRGQPPPTKATRRKRGRKRT